MKLYITNSADRDAVILALARNGYTIRQGTERKADGKQRVSFVEVIERESQR